MWTRQPRAERRLRQLREIFDRLPESAQRQLRDAAECASRGQRPRVWVFLCSQKCSVTTDASCDPTG